MQIIEYIFFLSLLFLQIPPFILLNHSISTHALVKILSLCLFIYLILFDKRIKTTFSKHRAIILLFILFFAFQSLSIMNAIDLLIFLRRYQNVMFVSFIFFESIMLLNNKNINIIIYIFLISFVINSLFQFFIYFFPTEFLKYGYFFINKEYMEIIHYNILRHRIYFDNYSEIFLPLFSYKIIKDKRIYINLSLFCYFFVQLFFSFVSMFRTHLLMYISTLFSTVILYKNKIRKYTLIIVLLSIIFLYAFYKLQISLYKLSVFQRIFEEDILGRQSTVVGRIKNWGKAFDIGTAFPIIGIGLGNYYNYLISIEKSQFIPQHIVKKGNYLAQQDPHNIFFSTFAETGFLGLISFLFLIFYFVKKDMNILQSNNLLAQSFIISFWSLFIFAILNPTFTITYQALFWIIRVAIEKLKVK